MTIIENKRNIIENKDSIFSYFGWPTVARINESTLAVVCSGYRLRHVCPFGKLVISYSYDEGKTWTKPAPVIDTPLDDRDGGICVDGKRIIVTSFNNDISFQRDNIKKCIAGGDTSKRLELMSAYLNNVTEEDPDEQEVEYEIILPDISDQDNLEEDPFYRDGYIEDEETDGESEDTKNFSE